MGLGEWIVSVMVVLWVLTFMVMVVVLGKWG